MPRATRLGYGWPMEIHRPVMTVKWKLIWFLHTLRYRWRTKAPSPRKETIVKHCHRPNKYLIRRTRPTIRQRLVKMLQVKRVIKERLTRSLVEDSKNWNTVIHVANKMTRSKRDQQRSPWPIETKPKQYFGWQMAITVSYFFLKSADTERSIIIIMHSIWAVESMCNSKPLKKSISSNGTCFYYSMDQPHDLWKTYLWGCNIDSLIRCDTSHLANMAHFIIRYLC